MLWLILIAVSVLTAWLYHQFVLRRQGLPKGPDPLPIIGNMHQLGESMGDWAQQLYEWSNEYGPVYTVWMPGAAVVIADYKSMKLAIAGPNADAFVSRTRNSVIEMMMGGDVYGLFFSEGERWRETRRFSLHTLRDFGFGRNLMEQRIHLDVERFVDHVDERITKSGSNQVQFDPDLALSVSVGSIVANLVIGKRYDFDDKEFERYMWLNRRSFEIFGKPEVMVLDRYPWLRVLPFFGHFGLDGAMNMMTDFEAFFYPILDTHKKDVLAQPDEPATDLVGAMFLEGERLRLKGETGADAYSRYNIFITVFDLWSAGMETTSITLRWALLYMTEYTDVQKRVHAELEQVLQGRRVSMSDKADLAYCQATILETMRFARILPVGADRVAAYDVKFGDFEIKKGTTVLIQQDSMLRDESVFENSNDFNPDRYLNKDGSLNTTMSEKVAVFGTGKRACLGESVARMNLFLMFCSIMQKYRLRLGETSNKEEAFKPVYFFTRQPGAHEIIFEKN